MPGNSERVHLAHRLRELRAGTGLSGNRFAVERMRWPQSRVSRLETGTQLPTEDDIHTWVQAFQPAMVIGLLQTPAYPREMLALPGSPLAYAGSAADLDAVVVERMRRQQVLYQTGTQVQLLMGEAALHKNVGTIGTLIGQLDRLMTMTALPSVDVGIVPFAVPMLPVPGFVIYDENVVTAESLTAEQRLIEPDEVRQYVNFFDELRALAVTGPDAVALIQQVTVDLRSGPLG